jgi:hypothetical protein
MIFRRNHIHHTGGHGEAFYLGSNSAPDGKTQAQFFHGIIEGNYVHDLNGPNVMQGDGIELKDGSWGNLVRDNVIHDVKYPGIIVYDADGKEPNVIEGNLIFNVADNGIQAAADAIIRNNLIFNCKGTGIYSRDHQSAVVGNLKILHNTVLSKGKTALRLIPPIQGKIFRPNPNCQQRILCWGGHADTRKGFHHLRRQRRARKHIGGETRTWGMERPWKFDPRPDQEPLSPIRIDPDRGSDPQILGRQRF